MQIFGSIVFIFKISVEVSVNELILGLSCMLTWVSLIRYLDHSYDYSFVPRTLGEAVPVILKTMAGILPLFLGFAFLGIALFWESQRFKSFHYSLFTLYAMMNGDMLWDTYHDISAIHFIIANIFLYCFIFFAIA